MTTETGEQDVIDLLIGQHQQIKALLAEVKSSAGEQRKEAFAELVRLLAVHESAEEQIVHPAARDDAGDDVVDARLREEDDAKTLLNELYEMGLDAPRFETRFAALETAVLTHAEQEEQTEFPALRKGTTAGRLRLMAGAVRVAEAIAPTRPHPQAGTHPLNNLIMGPPVAIFDKVREAVGDWRRSHDA
ncbi:Hemerythrin HHE cation binding domain-containing protein [Paractinoplanes atraurantiacus]|uniref:Hemerythrin HHE cation binding domain-containing protein n=1 Tax=Paractinoplanes atraurantiacus TaxID=1036182 RepID=A0A285GTN7_9ACTN|nr:Hemerythrin HHE cation binding domain-containing protein [Actinoplanes atraurantiacus]